MNEPLLRALHAFAWLVGATLGLTVLIVAGRLASGDGIAQTVRSASAFEGRALRLESRDDSWGPMFAARARLAAPTPAKAERSLYADTLQLDHCKFQYPPSALLWLELLPSRQLDTYRCDAHDRPADQAIDGRNWAAKPWLDAAARAAILATIAIAAVVLQTLLAPVGGAGISGAQGTGGAARRVMLWAAVFAAGLTFYPLIKPYGLGQIQVFLSFLVALAVLAMLKGRPAAAGVLIGLCVLVKPQLIVLLVWALLRREAAFAKGLVLVAGVGHSLALWRYGIAVHLDYVHTLGTLSRHGEVFWANQSFNGLLNRWFETGDPARWSYEGFPPYHPVVRWGTLVSSLLIVSAALWLGRGPQGVRGRLLDFCVIVAAATLASPIAWEHHYGVFFVLWAVALGAWLKMPTTWRPGRGLWVALILSGVLMANALLVPALFFGNRWTGLLASNLWFGALLLLAILMTLSRRESFAVRRPCS